MPTFPSRNFATQLLARYPAWRPFALVLPMDDGRGNCFAVRVLPPDGRDLARSLWVEARRGQVAIGLDHAHGDYSWPPFRGGTGLWRDPFALIAAILADEVAAASGWDGDRLSISWWAERGKDVRPVLRPRMDRIRVRSWNGQLDTDFAVGEPPR